MRDLLSLLGIGLGGMLVLGGLIGIANQVRVHRVRPASAASWVFRAGVGLSIAGLILVILSAGPGEYKTLGTWIGLAAGLGGLFTLNHERAQALDGGADRWDWPRSLTLQMMVSGAVIILLAVLG